MKRTFIIAALFVLGCEKTPQPEPTPQPQPEPQATVQTSVTPVCKTVYGWTHILKDGHGNEIGRNEVSIVTPLIENTITKSEDEKVITWSHVENEPCPKDQQLECLKQDGLLDKLTSHYNDPTRNEVTIHPDLQLVIDLMGEVRLCSFTIHKDSGPTRVGGDCEIVNSKPICKGWNK